MFSNTLSLHHWLNIDYCYTQGPNGLFRPKKESFVDCRNEELCSKFQDGKFPCTKQKHFKCEFDHEFGDGLKVKGHAVMGDVGFKLNDGSQSQVQIAFGYVGTCYSNLKSLQTYRS